MPCKFGRRATTDGGRAGQYTCCFCCHVRMGTVFLGVFNLIKDLLMVTVITAVTLHPELAEVQTNAISSYLGLARNFNHSINGNTTQAWSYETQWDCNDKFLGLVAIGSSLLTISLLYGAITARPRYILPFFWLQMFEFCIASLTVIGYFSYGPDIQKWIASLKAFPYREELLALGREWLLVLAALLAVIVLWTKAYCISIVWSCYKYLIYRLSARVTPSLSLETPAMHDMNDGGAAAAHRFDFNESELILPPKYEDLPPVSSADLALSAAPPAYDTLIHKEESGEGVEGRTDAPPRQ